MIIIGREGGFEMSELLTISEVAKRLKISYFTAYKYIKEEKIKSLKLDKCYRIKEEDLEKYIESRLYST